MRIEIEATDALATLDGVPCRVWKGVTDTGVACFVFVHRLAVDESQDLTAFDQDLAEQQPPTALTTEAKK